MAAVPPERFRAKVDGPGGAGGHYITLGPRLASMFGRKARTPVRGTVNGEPFRSSIFPRGDGSFYMVLNQEVRDAARIRGGETVTVAMEVDREPRSIKPPDDLARALARNPLANEAWERFPYSHRKEYVEWIAEAKKPETRERRLKKAIEMIASGKPQR
jgi:hypothetical protein